MTPLWLAAVVAGAPGPGRVGLVYGEGMDAAARRQVENAVASALGLGRGDLEPDARKAAASHVPYEVEEGRLDAHLRIRQDIGTAEQAARAGDFEGAGRALGRAYGRLDASPGVPGATELRVAALLVDARIRHAVGDAAARDALLFEAAALDPGRILSLRRHPPDFVEAYRAARARARAEARRPAWRVPPGVVVEVDGRPGVRPLPPGRHRVVVRAAGHAAHVEWMDRDAPVQLSTGPKVLAAAGELTGTDAAKICRLERLAWVVAARRQGGLLGLQAYDCAARRFYAPWVGPLERAGGGAAQMRARPVADDRAAVFRVARLTLLVRSGRVPPRSTASRVALDQRRKRRIGWGVGLGLSGLVAAVALGLAFGLASRGTSIVVDAKDFRASFAP